MCASLRLHIPLEHLEEIHTELMLTVLLPERHTIDAEATLEAAAAILGHSGTSVTSAHYIAKAAIAPDMSSILEQFGNEKR